MRDRPVLAAWQSWAKGISLIGNGAGPYNSEDRRRALSIEVLLA